LHANEAIHLAVCLIPDFLRQFAIGRKLVAIVHLIGPEGAGF
jgi:hypothetical protein